MKLRLIPALLFLILIPLQAQTDTDNHRSGSNVYGAPIVKIGKILDRTAVFVGGKGAMLVNDNYSVGLAGFSLASKLRVYENGYYNNVNINYGGVFVEYSPYSSKLIHFSLESLLGIGSIGISKNSYVKDRSKTYFVAETGINVILNVHRTFRVSVGGTYRFNSDFDLQGIEAKNLNGGNLNISVLIGIF